MSSLDGPRRGNYGSPRDSNQNTNNQGNPYNNNNTSSSNADPFGNGNNNGSNNNNNQPPQPQQQQTTRRRGQAAPKPSPPIDPILWVRSTLARDPFVEPSKTTQWNTFFLMTLVQSIGVSPENGYEMMGANFENLGKLLRSGVPNSGFFLVRRLCQAMYHSTGHMLVLFESDVQNNIAVLAALQMGILSDDREGKFLLYQRIKDNKKKEWVGKCWICCSIHGHCHCCFLLFCDVVLLLVCEIEKVINIFFFLFSFFYRLIQKYLFSVSFY